MTVAFRLAACLDFALALLKDCAQLTYLPLAGSHARQIALIFGAAFLITEFNAAWHILWRRREGARMRAMPVAQLA